jgi:hypothetical protein
MCYKSSGMLLKVNRFCLGWWGAEWLQIISDRILEIMNEKE